MARLKNVAMAGGVGLVAVGAAEFITTTDAYKNIEADVKKENPEMTLENVAEAVRKRQRTYRLVAGFAGGVVGVGAVAMFSGEGGVKSPTK